MVFKYSRNGCNIGTSRHLDSSSGSIRTENDGALNVAGHIQRNRVLRGIFPLTKRYNSYVSRNPKRLNNDSTRAIRYKSHRCAITSRKRFRGITGIVRCAACSSAYVPGPRAISLFPALDLFKDLLVIRCAMELHSSNAAAPRSQRECFLSWCPRRKTAPLHNLCARSRAHYLVIIVVSHFHGLLVLTNGMPRETRPQRYRDRVLQPRTFSTIQVTQAVRVHLPKTQNPKPLTACARQDFFAKLQELHVEYMASQLLQTLRERVRETINDGRKWLFLLLRRSRTA